MEVAEYLLEHGADVNAQDKGGLIPLHNAASYGVGAGSLAISLARDSLKSYPKPVFLQLFCCEHSSGFEKLFVGLSCCKLLLHIGVSVRVPVAQMPNRLLISSC